MVKHVTSILLNCNKKEKVYESRVARYKTCSKFCSNEYRSRNNKDVICVICNKKEIVNASRAKRYKTCSRECLYKYESMTFARRVVKNCIVCGKEFSMKICAKNRRKHCSKKCQAVTTSKIYLGLNNPNFKDRHIYKNYAIGLDTAGKSGKIHRAVVYEHFNVTNLPKYHQIHHRNSNKLDNRIENLALLRPEDHKWLHHQFGNAILHAIFCNNISMDLVCTFSKDESKAKKLLNACVLNQKIINNEVIFEDNTTQLIAA